MISDLWYWYLLDKREQVKIYFRGQRIKSDYELKKFLKSNELLIRIKRISKKKLAKITSKESSRFESNVNISGLSD